MHPEVPVSYPLKMEPEFLIQNDVVRRLPVQHTRRLLLSKSFNQPYFHTSKLRGTRASQSRIFLKYVFEGMIRYKHFISFLHTQISKPPESLPAHGDFHSQPHEPSLDDRLLILWDFLVAPDHFPWILFSGKGKIYLGVE